MRRTNFTIASRFIPFLTCTNELVILSACKKLCLWHSKRTGSRAFEPPGFMLRGSRHVVMRPSVYRTVERIVVEPVQEQRPVDVQNLEERVDDRPVLKHDSLEFHHQPEAQFEPFRSLELVQVVADGLVQKEGDVRLVDGQLQHGTAHV